MHKNAVLRPPLLTLGVLLAQILWQLAVAED